MVCFLHSGISFKFIYLLNITEQKCPRGNFYKAQSAGCQNNPIGVTFHIQKSLEIFEKNSSDKI